MEIHPKLASEHIAWEKVWASGTEIPGLQIWPRYLPAVSLRRSQLLSLSFPYHNMGLIMDPPLRVVERTHKITLS